MTPNRIITESKAINPDYKFKSRVNFNKLKDNANNSR